jgi:hypothetical protein
MSLADELLYKHIVRTTSIKPSSTLSTLKEASYGLLSRAMSYPKEYLTTADLKAGDHVVYVDSGPGKAYGVVDKVFDQRALVTWDNDWDRQILGNGPFWQLDLVPEPVLDRFARKIAAP